MLMSGCPYWWTGLKYNKSADTWYFMDGTDTTFALSKVHGKQYFELDKCVVIRNNGTIYPIDCAEQNEFICQTGQDPTNLPTLSG